MRALIRSCVIAIALTFAVAAPASWAQTAEEPPPSPADSGAAVAVGPAGTFDGQTQTGPTGWTPGEKAQERPSSGDPTVMAEFESCSGHDSQYILRVYSRAGGGGFASGHSSMRCGAQWSSGSGWGLRHIEARHRNDWQAKANYISTSWEDMLDFSVAQTLAAPSSVTYRSSNDTYTYRAPIQIYFWGSLVHQFTANVSVARVSKNIITAYPS